MAELSPHQSLKREVGLTGAVLLGLGSIIGTGIFVSIGLVAGVAGPAMLIAILLAALLASFNAFSSAQLAAAHPVSGGTYEYGYRYLTPPLGFTAGWMFLCAKSASAATAALGFAGYLLSLFTLTNRLALISVALATVLVLTLIVLGGMRRSNLTNAIIVGLTLLALAIFIAFGAPTAISRAPDALSPFLPSDNPGTSTMSLLEATALMFVAYTGYGRIATLGEEVHEPRRTIPRAIIITLIVSATLYLLVGFVALATLGDVGLAEATTGKAAPLEIAARAFEIPGIAFIVGIGAMTAMLGVLLNLILGLSRVLLAMGRRGDAPQIFGSLNRSGTTPAAAVIMVGLIIGGLAAIGSVKLAWSFSAFTVLIYYAITNLAALKLDASDRLYPRWMAWAGLIGCLGLAFWVEWIYAAAGVALIALGLIARRLFRTSTS